jgi:hypothetical protein
MAIENKIKPIKAEMFAKKKKEIWTYEGIIATPQHCHGPSRTMSDMIYDRRNFDNSSRFDNGNKFTNNNVPYNKQLSNIKEV